jgi:hypothetical protein
VLPAIALALAGCPGGPDLIDPQGAYPTLGEYRKTRDRVSALIIYTATFTDLNLSDDSGTMIRHTGYTIYNDQGQKYDYVRNFIGVTDTEPTRLDMEPGKYIIVLDVPEKQPPVFRIVIKPELLTTVTLPR